MLLVVDTSAAADSLDFDQLTQLEGRQYLLRFTWSARESSWYLRIYDQDQNPIALGIRLVVGWPLLRRFRDPRLPPGILFVGDTSETDQEISQPAELLPNGRCPLMYATSDDADLP